MSRDPPENSKFELIAGTLRLAESENSTDAILSRLVDYPLRLNSAIRREAERTDRPEVAQRLSAPTVDAVAMIAGAGDQSLQTGTTSGRLSYVQESDSRDGSAIGFQGRIERNVTENGDSIRRVPAAWPSDFRNLFFLAAAASGGLMILLILKGLGS